ncbi:O-antigen ligase family protein [Rhodanobacter glycinis]|uniref:O-antigen ligase family protein n=1 Tax=Rhodanobacter glycinis TaxID=582702 RepID=A0A5B9E0W0_9GAMM|nr:O-antigen ligase family protein [Rhodanobacter glycinis]QEE25972.1 O-antigen ligase family protein [Rhodanobacter glycinis]
MTSFAATSRAILCSPLTPFWLVVALLPFGRSAELGTLLCLIGLLWQCRHGMAPWRDRRGAALLLVLLAAYVGAALWSAFDAVAPAKSWSSVAGLLRYVPLGLYACLVIRRTDRLYALYAGVAAVLALWVLAAWLQIVTGWSPRGVATGEYLTGLFGNDLKFGPTLAVLSPFALWAARMRWGGRGLLVAFLLLLGPVLLAGSRSAWLCYALVALAFAWREAGTTRRFLGLCAAGAVLLMLAGGVAWKTSARFDARMQRTLDVFHGGEQGLNAALTGRLDIWRVSARMIAAHPFNGVGVRGFRYAYPHYAPADDHFVVAESCGVGQGACHPHQWVLEVLASTGVVGLLLWLAGLAWALRAWRQVGTAARMHAFPATLALGVMLFPLNSHLAFYSAWWGLLFAWLLALWCAGLFVADMPAGKAKPGVPAGLFKKALPLEHRDAA